MFLLFNLQFTVGMHSVNAVLLLGETSLNCMVSLFFLALLILLLNYLTSNLQQLFLLNTCRAFQCFDLHILSCGQLHLWFFSGSSMPLFRFGKTVYPIFFLLLFNRYSSVHNLLTFSYRWPYPFLDLSSPYAPLWYVLKFHWSPILKYTMQKKKKLPLIFDIYFKRE